MHRDALRLLACALASLGSACAWIHPTEPLRPVPSEVALPRFEEVPVDFAHRWDHATSHHLTGAAVLDVDGDGRQEVFAGGGAGQPDALLALEDGRLVDRIEGTGLSSLAATYGSCAIDLDGDADVDLVVARNDGLTLYLNEGGRFRAQPLAVDLPENSVPLAVAAADIEHDGDVDLYVSVFVDFPHFVPATFNVPAHAKANRLLRNDGDLHFTDVTTSVTASKQNTFTSLFVDLDGDRYQDLVVAQNTGQVEILRNLHDGGFAAVPFESGYGFWMGVAAGDVDGDGDQDLAFTNVGDAFPAFAVKGDRHDDQPYAGGWRLWRNDGGFRFTDITHEAGLDGMGFAWGIVFEDVNFDGRLDLLASQNYVKWPVYRFFKFPGKVLLQTGAGPEFRAADVAENRAYSNSPVVADLDGDARPDLFWLNNDGPSRAYLNRSEGRAVVVGMPDAPSSLGAQVRLEGRGAHYTREIASSSGLGSDQSADLVFGLGAFEHAERLVVSWPDGRTLVIEDPPVGRRIAIEPPAMAGAGSLAQTGAPRVEEVVR
ncbi:MAG TPA: CRTAC1 family protein [Myxococcota bacterium]|nr:CRTAC1 family protein [Myxococcota bacterium]